MIDEILESYEMRAKAAEDKAARYETALNQAIYVIIQNAKAHNCEGCPLKGSGLPRNQNSCRNRLTEYFMNHGPQS